MKEQILRCWQIHHSKNVLLLESLSEPALEKSVSARGRTIRQQFIHLHNVRLQWLEVCAKDIFKNHNVIDKSAVVDKKQLLAFLDDSSKALLELFDRAWENAGMVRGFKSGLIPMLGYFISHESHHRGNILLTLKQSGEKIPDAVKWGLWEWTG